MGYTVIETSGSRVVVNLGAGDAGFGVRVEVAASTLFYAVFGVCPFCQSLAARAV